MRRIDIDSPDTEVANDVTISGFPFDELSRSYTVPDVVLLTISDILWQVAPYLKGADVLHCYLASLQTAGAALAGRIAVVPIILKAATADLHRDFGVTEKTRSCGWLVAWFIRVVIQRWVVTTFGVKHALIRRAGVAVVMIIRLPNGVDLTTGPNTRLPPNRAKLFLYLGRLSINTQRELPTLIAVFDRLAALHPDVELAAVGGVDLLDDTRSVAASYESRDRILMPGFGESAKWLAWSNCFVLPSRREGLLNALIEAMAEGLPCIANDIPPNRKVLDYGEATILVQRNTGMPY